MTAENLTVGDVARLLGVEDWHVRRVVDRLPTPVPRVGRYRLIPRSLLPAIDHSLRKHGWTPTTPPIDEPTTKRAKKPGRDATPAGQQ
jgi:excisionase family DNA binding protein